MPYDAGPTALADAVDEIVGLWTDAKSVELSIWIPTAGGTPIASSPLIAEPPDEIAEIELAPWTVTALPLSLSQTVDLLCACADSSTLATGVFAGKSLTYWASVLRFAGSLVARQNYLPAIVQSGSDYFTRWQPVLAGPDRETANALAASMPQSCRAVTLRPTPPRSSEPVGLEHPADAPAPLPKREGEEHNLSVSASSPSTPAFTVLSNVLGSLVDTQVRQAQPSARPEFGDRILHDRWLRALMAPDRNGEPGRLTGTPTELDELLARWREWTRPITISLNAPFRLCFRLEEPQAEASMDVAVDIAESVDATEPIRAAHEEEWIVRFLLQAVDDPSLLIPVEKAWTPKGRTASMLAKRAFQPREYLLTALGQAARICPEIEETMKSSAPSSYTLDTHGAFEFLSEQAFLLEQVGFGVMLPRWWTRKGARARLSSRAQVKSPKMQSTAGLSLDTIVDFEWEVAVGDTTLTRAELEALAIEKAGLVKIRGQWVQIDAGEIQSVLKLLRSRSGSMTARDVVRMALGADFTSLTPSARGETTLPVEGVDATGWVGELLTKLTTEAALEQTPPPPDFHATLRPYQERGYSWMNFLRQWGFGACLADDMGLGKTVQVLAHVQREWASGERRPTLVVSPTSVVGNWNKEAERFTPHLPVMVHHGSGRKRGAHFVEEAQKHGIVLSSYALLQRDFEHLSQVPWAAIVLDEAQNIKNPETKQSKTARALGNPSPGPSPKRRGEKGEELGAMPAALGRHADAVPPSPNEPSSGAMPATLGRHADAAPSPPARIALTGTPVENHVGDLWSVMEFINPGFLGTQSEFKRAFFHPIQSGENPEAAVHLKKLTAPFILRRLKSDKSIIADLPEMNEMRVYCTLTREQASLYQAVVRETEEALQKSEGIQRKGLILATLAKLKQVCNHPAQFLGDNSAIPDRSGKLARLQEMIEEVLSVGDRALIFSQFYEMGEIIRRHLQETLGDEVLFLHGGVQKEKRDRMVERFQSANGPRLFLLSLKAGGTGLTLTNANHVFHYDRWWNPAVENQATDRAYRIGQKKQVQVHKFVCAGTLEERIDEMIESKQKLAANVVGTGEDWLTEMSTAELKQLFKLRQEAISD